MHLDVVGVAVAAVVVVDGEDVRLLLVEDHREPPGGVVDGGPPEAVRGVVGRLAHHPGVGPAEELHAVRADLPRRGVALGRAPQRQRLAVGEHAGHGLAQLAAGGEHDHHAVAGVDGTGQRAGGADRLVVGMGVEADDGPHGPDPNARGRRTLECEMSEPPRGSLVQRPYAAPTERSEGVR